MAKSNRKIKTGYLSNEKRTTLDLILKSLKEKICNKEEIAAKLYEGLHDCFNLSGVNIYLLDPISSEIDYLYPESDCWPIPQKELTWLCNRTKDLLIKNSKELIDNYYIENRELESFVDQAQFRKDQTKYNYSCSDGLYWTLLSEEEMILGIIFIHNWEKKLLFSEDPQLDLLFQELGAFISKVTMALDSFMIHKKIESLLTDKQKLKERLQKDEEDLRRRLLEQSVLYDTSAALGSTMNYYQMISLIMIGLKRVLSLDICAILLFHFNNSNEIELLIRIHHPVTEDIVKAVQKNILKTGRYFFSEEIDKERVNVTTEKQFSNDVADVGQFVKSFANVPLVFKNEVLGMMNVCSTSENVFTRSEMTFLHTMANQLSSHLGRLRLVKEIERTKIGSMIGSMTEGVLMMNENNQLDMINTAARAMLGFPAGANINISSEELISRLADLEILDLYYDVLLKGESILNHELFTKDRIISTNVTPVMDFEKNRIGMVMVLRDVTELQKINRINQQRLDIISKVNLIINSITDLDNLLAFLIEFILNVANAEMGSIQLKEGRLFKTKVHSNFPDKIRREYCFVSGETISEYVVKSKEIYFVDNYGSNENLCHDTKIAIESYVCIPIVVKQDLIGVVNIVRKKVGGHQPITLDDIETLTTITSLSGTAIHNALLYLETLRKEKLDQELKVAHEIQKKLLPSELPLLKEINFGATSLPAHEIGGDYYDFFELENGLIGIVVADIVGKGIPAALHMVMIKSILRSNIIDLDSPKKALEKMNALLEKDTVISRYVPVFYGIVDPRNYTFKYCNAGHEPGIFYSDGSFQTLDSDGFPLGAWSDSQFEEKQVQIKPDDIIVLFTDGIIEARNEHGDDFGHERLREIICQNATKDAEGLTDALFQEVIEFTGSQEQHDDLTIVFIKRSNRIVEEPIISKEIRITSAKKNIAIVRKEVEKIAEEMGFKESDIFNIKLAVNEAQANVLEHAYRGNENGEIVFTILVYENRLTILIKDFGPGIDQKTVKGEQHLQELEGSGLGVFLINTLMDKVEYNRKTKVGTEMVLTKYLRRMKADGTD